MPFTIGIPDGGGMSVRPNFDKADKLIHDQFSPYRWDIIMKGFHLIETSVLEMISAYPEVDDTGEYGYLFRLGSLR